ncbi:MAG: hypothetical protein M5U12_05965 [Verrucomicrobia bacterium]|nr:hypothetical protein [Verrucomicrobiota bacterium]
MTGVHLVDLAEALDAGLGLVGLGVDEFVPVGAAAAEDRLHFGGPDAFEVEVGVIEVVAHLVLKMPGQLAVQLDLMRVVLEALVAQELDAALDPAPAVGGAGELDRDVVGHVPGHDGPDGGDAGLELGDPVGELDHLEEAVFVLEFHGADPEGVGDEAAEAAEDDGGEHEDRGAFSRGFDAGEAEVAADAVEVALGIGDGDEEDGGEGEAAEFEEFAAGGIHGISPCRRRRRARVW